jgi:hypothetical protein
MSNKKRLASTLFVTLGVLVVSIVSWLLFRHHANFVDMTLRITIFITFIVVILVAIMLER